MSARLVATLAIVGAVAGALVAVFARATAPAIERAREAALHKALAEVLPAHANAPQREAVWVAGRTIYPARDAGGRLVGLAFVATAPDGYSGAIQLLLGLSPDGRIWAVRVLEHRETPGLGDQITRADWLGGFRGRSLHDTRWEVKKRGGDIDEFTGATITPSAVARAIGRALAWYAAHAEEIRRALDAKGRMRKKQAQGGAR